MPLDLEPVLDLQPADEGLDLQPLEEPKLDLQPAEAGGTLTKARFAAAGAAAQTVAGVGTGLKELADIGPAKPNFRRHEAAMLRAGQEQIPYESAMGQLLQEREAQRQRLMAPGQALETTAGEAAAAARDAAEATEGNKAVTKGAELVGGMLPYLLTGPAAPAVAGVSSYGTTYQQAYDFYRKQGRTDQEARDQAQKVAGTAGLATGEIFLALPGFGKAAAERLLAKRLMEASPVVRTAVNTLAASAQGSLVMGSDALVRSAQAKLTYRPEMTWGQALEEAAKEAAAGAVGTAIIHAPGEVVRALKTRAQQQPTTGIQRGQSEFGGEADLPPPSSQAGLEKARPGANAEEVSGPTVPESAETLNSQLEWLQQGKRNAVLLTPGSPDVAVPEGMKTHDTPAGRFIFNPDQVKSADLDAAVTENRVGEVLGYGIAARPKAGTESGVVTVRGADGQEKQAVVTDEANLGQTLKAARELAGPGDTVQLESGQEVIQQRKEANAIDIRNQPGSVQPQREGGDEGGQAAEAGGGNRLQPEAEGGSASAETETQVSLIAKQALRESLAAREEVEADLLARAGVEPDALPKGYQATGTSYVFQEPERGLTPAQRLRQENAAAVEALRKSKRTEQEAAEKTETRPTELVEEGTPVEVIGERPPDILDWIGDNFPSGVRVSSKADYGDYLDQARGRAKELLKVKKGEAPDQVLKEMHEQGMWPRIESEDDLLEAMNRASEARLGAKAEADKIEAWLKRAIEATDPLKGGQLLEGVTGAPIWLTKTVLNAALRVMQAAYTKTRDLAQAIAAAVEHVRGLNLPNFNAAELQDYLAGSTKERQTAAKVAASTAVSDPTKEAITEYLYQQRTNANDEALAADIVQDFGLDRAEQMLRSPPAGLHGATWSKLLGAVTRQLADHERQARTAQDAKTADGLAERQAKLWNDVLPKITELAQSLQGLNDIVDMSPDAQVARLRQQLEGKADDELARHRPELEQMQGALEQGRRDGLEAVRQDPDVNGAARAAVDQAVTGSEETRRAVVMDMAEPWASSPEIMRMAREQVASKANELLNRAPRPPGLTVAQHLRRIMDDLAQRAATIFAAHLQGAEPQTAIVEKLMQRLGLTRERTVSLAGALSKEWDRQLKAAQAKLPRRIAAQRVAKERATGATLESPTSAVDAAIRRQLRELNLKLGDVLKQEVARQDQSGAHVTERVVQTSGLTGEKADTLRNVLQNRWNALVTEAQMRALDALQKNSGIPVKGKLKDAFTKLVELDRLGALTSEGFFDVVKKSLKLKQLTQQDAATLRSLARKAQDQPEGFLRQQAAGEAMKFVERLKGNVNWRDVPMAIFYANILSGLTTPAKIVIENANLLASSTAAALLSRPREVMQPVQFAKTIAGAYKRGLAKGVLQASSTLKTGTVTGIWEGPRLNVLEMKPFGARMEPLNFWKWFGRVIGTAHELTFKPAWEVKQALLAREMARREGLRGRALEQRVANLLADTEGAAQEARGQAVRELQDLGNVSKLELARRAREIIEQRREASMPGTTAIARDFALRTAYLNEPYGFLGFIATAVRSGLEKGRAKFPVFGTMAKTQVPFTTVVANILNEKLNWTPWGLARAAVSHKTGELYGRTIMDPSERAELYAKAIVGTVAMGTMAALFGDHIHGNGPSDPRKRRQLQAAGWIPHSIEWNGHYHTYMHTPAGVGLAIIGNMLDWHRYGKGGEADNVSRTAFALKATANAIVSQGMLDSLKRIFEALGTESTTEGADKLQKLTARTASSMVVPNLVQQVDRLFDPTVYDKTGVGALLTGQIPFVRRQNKPVLTVLGDPIEVGPFHYWGSKVTDDPLLRTIAEKQAWVTEPSRQQIIGDRKRGPDYFRAMTPDEYYDWIAVSGKEIRRRLEDNLDRIALAEPDEARKFVQSVAEEERAIAKKLFE